MVIKWIFIREFEDNLSFWMLWSLSGNISIFLMQEHNSKEYEKFLYIIRNYICCCWKSSIFYSLDQILETNNYDIKNVQHKNNYDDTIYETHGLSANPVPITMDDLSESSIK